MVKVSQKLQLHRSSSTRWGGLCAHTRKKKVPAGGVFMPTQEKKRYPTFACITPRFPHLHHSVTLWLFLYFSGVLGISCSSSKQTSFTSKLTASCWNPTKIDRYIWEKLRTELKDSFLKQIHFLMRGNCFGFIHRLMFSLYVSYAKFFLT